ncbi:CCA tRNA nucleotidyltransferase, mitochondrial [Puccinia graminis f. sp. tritici]|uniref:CCA tRNA nucleotidyltransferase, mitochondrial n=1 Tax=Puccinia graminis f. sp. tritici TaxID=56615 RepID=A0A5B0RCP4_PUCGR|nr:CCA tRNA nucleotidyltransferase, mitochondrial [Puccinia graminis f. sp. tritici]KAA1122978.1 CCA tRNA nucleotidyltransferase, mitochondrial [Puccinia graminis f. sp. tritici]
MRLNPLRNYFDQQGLSRLMGCLKRRTTSTTDHNQPNQKRLLVSRMTMRIKKDQEIELNRAESKLCQLLNQSVSHLKASASSTNQDLNSLTLRIAGGWVRDKLLGVQSNDLDIAISSLTGQDFATRFSSYLRDQQRLKREGQSENQTTKEAGDGGEETFELGKIATIEARPDQSKHLETATTTFLGLDLDFVQLRSEEYGDQDSRIPSSVRFGTPLEDALRRDITINSLFYNVHTGAIEDHTGKGLEDLEVGLIRTPLPAEHTFKDDPLRLLRCIRFATRFGFRLDADIVSAATSEPIRVALKEKISRERVGTEVDKMLKGRDPLSSLKMIEELGLYKLVFSPPKSLKEETIEPSIAVETATCLAGLLHLTNDSNLSSSTLPPNISKLLPRSNALKRRLFLASALSPYRELKAKAGKKELWAGEVVLMESLKLGNHDKSFISNLYRSLEVLNSSNLESILKTTMTTSPSIRVELGRLLRLACVHDLKQSEAEASLNWQSSLLFALVIELTRSQSQASSSELRNSIINTFDLLVQKILDLDLTFVVTPEFEKRRLDGKEICQVLKTKPGKHLGQIIERVIDRQIEYPDQTKEEGSKWLEDQLGAGLIKIS